MILLYTIQKYQKMCYNLQKRYHQNAFPYRTQKYQKTYYNLQKRYHKNDFAVHDSKLLKNQLLLQNGAKGCHETALSYVIQK